MKEKLMKKIVNQYFKAYNEFDLEGMIKNIHRDIVFKNYAGGEVTLELKGKSAFKTQIEQAFALFKNREMKIIEQEFGNDMIENKIDFKGVLAVDISDKLKKYDLIKLQSKSIFRFKNGKIISIEDIN
ncbi:MAG: nuclear transport factor 2 family protein [Methanobacterium sp.]|jgi:ketosteroid isomerase-like protein